MNRSTDRRLQPEELERLLQDLDISSNHAIENWPVDRKVLMRWRAGEQDPPPMLELLLNAAKALAVAQRVLAALPEEHRPPHYATTLELVETWLERVTGHRAVNGAKQDS